MQRRRAILAAHPDVRSLHGREPRTALAVFALVALQLGAAVAVGRAGWLVTVALGWTVGALVSHGLGVLVHECSHDLVFARPAANKALAILANVPHAAPAAMEFRYQHILHHQHLGDADGKDTQAPTRAEQRWVGASAWRKLLSFTFGRFFYPSRPANKVPVDGWLVANAVVVVGAMGVLFALAGARPVVYLVVASLAAFGPHPTGARRLSEHLPVRGPDGAVQPTLSYYGLLNRLAFDVGYHVEHHDFPQVPWTRMRELHRRAVGWYEPLRAVRSWTALLARHVLDPAYRVEHYVGMGGVVEDAAPYAPEAIDGIRT